MVDMVRKMKCPIHLGCRLIYVNGYTMRPDRYVCSVPDCKYEFEIKGKR